MKDEFAKIAHEVVGRVDWKFDDARMPTETERKRLARLMYLAFLDIRMLSLQGKLQQDHDLAEAVHNVPLLMYSRSFSFKALTDFLESYQRKYRGSTTFNYPGRWEKLSAEPEADNSAV